MNGHTRKGVKKGSLGVRRGEGDKLCIDDGWVGGFLAFLLHHLLFHQEGGAKV